MRSWEAQDVLDGIKLRLLMKDGTTELHAVMPPCEACCFDWEVTPDGLIGRAEPSEVLDRVFQEASVRLSYPLLGPARVAGSEQGVCLSFPFPVMAPELKRDAKRGLVELVLQICEAFDKALVNVTMTADPYRGMPDAMAARARGADWIRAIKEARAGKSLVRRYSA